MNSLFCNILAVISSALQYHCNESLSAVPLNELLSLQFPGDKLLSSAVSWRRSSLLWSTHGISFFYLQYPTLGIPLFCSILSMSFSPLQYPGDEPLSSGVPWE